MANFSSLFFTGPPSADPRYRLDTRALRLEVLESQCLAQWTDGWQPDSQVVVRCQQLEAATQVDTEPAIGIAG